MTEYILLDLRQVIKEITMRSILEAIAVLISLVRQIRSNFVVTPAQKKTGLASRTLSPNLLFCSVCCANTVDFTTITLVLARSPVFTNFTNFASATVRSLTNSACSLT